MTDFPDRVLTIFAETDLEWSSVPDHDRPMKLKSGESVDFFSVDTLYIRAAEKQTGEVGDDE